jgi:hypothetical protein
MLKPYKVTHKFYYDGEFEASDFYTTLLEEPIDKEIAGDDFDLLWKLKLEYPWLVPWGRYERKKGRALGRWDALFCHVHEWKNNVKPWRVVITSEETTITMKELMSYNTDKVIQYLKERGITTCPMNF